MLARLLSGLFAKSGGAPDAAQPDRHARAIEAYIAAHPVRKLHLGAGKASPPGWLATDIAPSSEEIVYLDASKRFPIADATFDYVYSEHMIEHIAWDVGRRMLAECRRILKPGGTLRVATPDLAVIIGLYRSDDPMAARYVRWITDRSIRGLNAYHPAFVINNAFRNWGHQFLYDAEVLQASLRDAGFRAIRRCAYGESADGNLRGVECHGRNIGDEAIAAFETMVFEADRPRA